MAVDIDGMSVVNDLAAQLGTALRDLALSKAQMRVLEAELQQLRDSVAASQADKKAAPRDAQVWPTSSAQSAPKGNSRSIA